MHHGGHGRAIVSDMSEPVARLWHEVSHDLRKYFARRVRDDALADDLLQDTFVKISEKLPTLRDDQRVTAWIYRIARNTLVDHARRSPKDVRVDVDLAEDDVEGRSLNAEVAGWLRPMLASLAPADREALELTELDDLSQKELADRLGLSPSGARTRVQRARRRLRETLDACCKVELDRRGNVIDYEPRARCCD